jgi:O-antigen/teichoic acid export membrane protein
MKLFSSLNLNWGALSRRPLLRNMGAAMAGNSGYFFFQIIRNFFIAGILGPLYFGAWNLGMVLLQYAQLTHLGILNAFRLDGARSRGAGNVEKLERLRRLTWTILFVTAAGTSVLAIIASIFIQQAIVRISVVVLAFCLLPLQFYQFQLASLMAEEKFVFSSRIQILFAAINLFLTVILGFVWSFWGILCAQIMSYGITFAAIRNRLLLFPPFQFEKKLWTEQFRVGFPIWLNAVAYTILVAVDRTLIPIGLGMTALGHYSLTALARSSIGLIPSSVSEVIYVRASTEYGAHGLAKTTVSLILRSNRLIALLTIIPIGLAILWIPLIIRLILPAYQPGIPALQIFLMGLFFLFPVFGGTLLTVIGRAKENLAIMCFTVVLQIGLVLIGMKLLGLEGISFATGISTMFYYSVANWWCFRRMIGNRPALGHIIFCAMPWGGFVVSLQIINIVFRKQWIFSGDLLQTVLASILLCILMLPMIIIGVRQSLQKDLIGNTVGDLITMKS